MQRILIALIALLDLLQRTIDAIRDHQTKKQRADYEQDVQTIRDDPVGYANRKFGGVRDTKASTSDMHGNDPTGAGDPVPQRPGNHPD